MDVQLHSLYCNSNIPQKDKEDLEEISTELELADEDELVPYVRRP